MARKRDAVIKLNLRLPEALHRRLERIAARNNQSLNSEMIKRLEKSFNYEWSAQLEEETSRIIRTGVIQMAQALARGDDEEMRRVARKALEERDKLIARERDKLIAQESQKPEGDGEKK